MHGMAGWDDGSKRSEEKLDKCRRARPGYDKDGVTGHRGVDAGPDLPPSATVTLVRSLNGPSSPPVTVHLPGPFSLQDSISLVSDGSPPRVSFQVVHAPHLLLPFLLCNPRGPYRGKVFQKQHGLPVFR